MSVIEATGLVKMAGSKAGLFEEKRSRPTTVMAMSGSMRVTDQSAVQNILSDAFVPYTCQVVHKTHLLDVVFITPLSLVSSQCFVYQRIVRRLAKHKKAER